VVLDVSFDAVHYTGGSFVLLRAEKALEFAWTLSNSEAV
jgi:hypothetical protein